MRLPFGAWRQRNREVTLLALLALGVGLAACALVMSAAFAGGLDPVRLTGDAKGYVQLAENLHAHGAFSFSKEAPFAPDSFRAPGYPMFLATLFALTGNWLAVLVLQALLLALAPVLLYLLLRPFHERGAWWGAVVFVFEPIRLYASSTLLSDGLFVCLLLGALLCLSNAARRRSLAWALLAGFLLGVSVLVRPIAQFLPLFFVGVYFASGMPWRKAAVLCAASLLLCAIAVLPWMTRNHSLFGHWGISSVGSYNLAAYNAAEYAKHRPTEGRTRTLEAFAARQQSLPAEERTSLARAEEFTAVFKEVVRGSELDYTLFHVFKTLPFFLTDGLRDTVRLFKVDVGTLPNITSLLMKGELDELIRSLRSGGLPLVLLVVGSGFWAGVLLLGAYSVVQFVRQRRVAVAVMFACIVLYFALLTGPVSNARYRLPAEGFLLAAAAVGALHVRERFRGAI